MIKERDVHYKKIYIYIFEGNFPLYSAFAAAIVIVGCRFSIQKNEYDIIKHS
jgi:hypothetical protein